jgi:hypothetical protein
MTRMGSTPLTADSADGFIRVIGAIRGQIAGLPQE